MSRFAVEIIKNHIEVLIEVTKTHTNNHVAHEFQRPIYYSCFEQNVVPSLPDPDQRESERFAVACNTKHNIHMSSKRELTLAQQGSKYYYS
jgi:hypothetical protein